MLRLLGFCDTVNETTAKPNVYPYHPHFQPLAAKPTGRTLKQHCSTLTRTEFNMNGLKSKFAAGNDAVVRSYLSSLLPLDSFSGEYFS